MKRGMLVFCPELDKRLIIVVEKNGKALTKDREKKYRVIPTEKLKLIK